MFGRVRPSPSSPEILERLHSKVIKDDPLSIYEATLAKLRQGSKLNHVWHSGPESSEAESTKSQTDPDIQSEEVMLIDTDCFPTNVQRNSSESGSVCGINQQKSRNHSVLYMFAKFKNSHHRESSPKDGDEDMETDDVSCLTDSQSCSDSRAGSKSETPSEVESSG